MHARVTTLQRQPGVKADASDAIAPGHSAGFLGAYQLLDRATGKRVAITLWESEEAMVKSGESSAGTRAQNAARRGEEIVSVEQFEVILHP